jgi:hypothetical protein
MLKELSLYYKSQYINYYKYCLHSSKQYFVKKSILYSLYSVVEQNNFDHITRLIYIVLELKDVRINLKYKTHLWLCPGAVIHIDSDVQFTSPGNEHINVPASVEQIMNQTE